MPPFHFIPLAEQTGLIVPIGQWVLERACRDAMNWPAHYKVAVNVSPVQFQHQGLVSDVEGALRRSGLPPERLELEITESTVVENGQQVTAILERLRSLGISIAMDDFGSGYSSLNTLWRFPFDKLKIDRNFVMSIGEDARILEILATIIGMAKTLRLVVAAEGIETEDQLLALKQLHCDQVQGYYLGRPSALNHEGECRQALPEAKGPNWSPKTGRANLEKGCEALA